LKVFQLYKSRKYLQRILLTVTLLMVIFLTVFSFASYYNSESTVLNVQEEANRKFLYQLEYNIEYMNELVKNLATATYFDSQIIPLLYPEPIEIFEIIQKINRLEKIVYSTTFLKSIVVYNQITDTFYSTDSGTGTHNDPDVSMLKAYIQEHRNIPKLKLVPIRMTKEDSTDKSSISIFSSFIYELRPGQNMMDGALIFNIKTEWLFDNIKALNGIGIANGNQIYISDNNGDIFTPVLGQGDYREEIKEILTQRPILPQDTVDSFVQTLAGDKMIFTVSKSGADSWRVTIVQPYDQVLGKLKQMRNTSIMVTLLFLALSVVLSWVISLKLYKPVEAMVSNIRKSTVLEGGYLNLEMDELSYVSSAYHQAMDKMKGIKSDFEAKKSIVEKYYARKLIMDSTSISEVQFSDLIAENALKIGSTGPYLLGVLDMDHFNKLSQMINHSELRLYKFAISNIAHELISQDFLCEIVDMRNDHLVILVTLAYGTVPEDEVQERLKTLFQEVIDTLYRFYRISLTASISDPIINYEEITHDYVMTLHNVNYRMKLGGMQVITPSLVSHNQENPELHIPAELEDKLIESMNTGQRPAIESNLDKLYGFIANLHFDHMFPNLLRISLIMHNALREVNLHRLRPISFDVKEFNKGLLEVENLSEVEALFQTMLDQIFDEMRDIEVNRNVLLINTVKEIIEDNYPDSNLSLQEIASMVRMSPIYLGRVFKDSVNLSVADYITEVRLISTIELLENNRYTIIEIMDKVGFSNQSSFFRSFKRKFGVTPKEFRTRKLI
jgi:AraC-like DNA-binding protein